MIGRLAGRIDWRGSDHVLIDVRGVGYIVHVSERTLAALPGPGGMAALYTELVVREDLMQLFGFLTMAEKEWHRLLTSVQGVGAKAGLSILGALGTEGLARAIAIGDAGALRKAPGVGPKLAQRVVLELKDKAPAVMALAGRASAAPALPHDDNGDVIESPAPKRPVAAPPGAAQAQADALSALTNLGYGPSEAAAAVAEAGASETETPALIRAALRLLAPRG